MSTQRVERLQALLAKVQNNRDAPRAGATSAAASVTVRPPAPANAAPAPAARKPAAGAQAPTTPVGMAAPPAQQAKRAPAVEEELDFSSLPPPGATRAAAAGQEPAFTPAERRTRPGATPLELAVEDTLDRPAVAPVAKPAPPARAPVAPPAAAPAPAAASARREGVVLADPAPPAPSRPIAQVLSKQPPVTPTSFGDLLKRSLSLRPR